MILQSVPKQFMLADDGQILWQADASNPLPGEAVAILRKGAGQLQPEITLLETGPAAGVDQDALTGVVKAWLEQHIQTVLEPLTELVKEEGGEGPAQEIATRLHDALGIMPRQDLEELIAGLDADGRKALRQRKVRLGPILVFVPELNKPAAVRLRALLWWLWHDRILPAPLPKDGVVSVLIADGDSYDPDYQRAIGYPVYGGRAIRADMLDRLIGAIYDGAKGGVFKATHAMAEWMGCSIPDLYKIIESMGHRKIVDPAEAQDTEAKPTDTKEDVVVETPVMVDVSEDASATPEVTAEATPEQTSKLEQELTPAATIDSAPEEKKQEKQQDEKTETTDSVADKDNVAVETAIATDIETAVAPTVPTIAVVSAKPELATFRLKRGRAHESARPPRHRAVHGGRKAGEKEGGEANAKKTPRPSFRTGDKAKRDKAGFKGKRGQDRPMEKRQTSFEARPDHVEESPFAVLRQLQTGMKDK